jgi:hypothetical protein
MKSTEDIATQDVDPTQQQKEKPSVHSRYKYRFRCDAVKRRRLAGFSPSTAVVRRQVVAVDESNTAADSVRAFSRPNPPTLCYLICVSTPLLFCV